MKLSISLLAIAAFAQVPSSRMAVSSKVTVGSRGATGSGGFITLTVVGISNTQVAISYTAPSTSACTVQASESPTYSPSVNDVNTTLFSNSNRDDRDGDLGAGTTSRLIVIGRRSSEYALDSAKYSRALQAYKAHYVQVTCGVSTGVTTFTTSNIPGGMTYQDVPSADVTRLGEYVDNWMIPTMVQDNRSATQIDQYTGAYLQAVTIESDKQGSDVEGFNMTSGGFRRVCTAGLQTTTDGKVGHVCQFLLQGPSATMFYFIESSTGLVRKLGRGHPSDGPPCCVLDINMCYIGHHTGDAVRYCYNGDWQEHDEFPVDGGTLFSDVAAATQLFAYDSTFDSALFGCGDIPWANAGEYLAWQCTRPNGQDSYGWIFIYYGGDGRAYDPMHTATPGGLWPGIVAAFNPMTNIRCKYCGNHTINTMPNVPVNPTIPMGIVNWHGLNNNGTVGTAAWETTFGANASGGATSIVLATKATSQYSGGDTFDPGNPAVGDVLFLPNGQERLTITSISGSGPFTAGVTPALANGYNSGDVIRWDCNATNTAGAGIGGWKILYWDFINDPHGTDTTGTYMIFDQYFDSGGHYDDGPNGRVSEAGWQVVPGNITTNLNTNNILIATDSPTFHGLGTFCFSSACPKHPTWHQNPTTLSGDQRNWFTDQVTFNGGPGFYGENGTAVSTVSGTLYKYLGAPPGADAQFKAQYPAVAGKNALWRKVLPTVAISGGRPLLDISSTSAGDVIGTGAGDNWKFCVAYLAGECRSGSSAGDIYFNHPNLVLAYCSNADGAVPDRLDICISAAPAHSNSIPRMLSSASDTTNATRRSQIYTHGVRGIRQNIAFAFAKILPIDASWLLFPAGYSCTANVSELFCNLWMAKNTPFPAQDAYNRADFIPVNTGEIVGGGMVDNAIVQFGYSEFGTNSQLYCTSRAESCYANSATVPTGTNPFSYPSDGSVNTLISLAGVPCDTTCTIDIPALSGHTLYYRILKRNAANGIISTGDLQLAIVP